MKKIIFWLSFIFVMSLNSSTAGFDWVKYKRISERELMSVVPIDEVLLYCNKKSFIENMVSKSYKMQLAAGGLVHDDRHKHLSSIQVWINPNNSQWAIVYVYKKQDRSCVLGGNDIELYTP